ncbi:copper chaperone PCu(A)C [Streptomonospora salina]|uniref:Copper(I)-binding protein n=1 Tax=Streptomonospora salina TaxID=104205 RepID=A0A841EI15_9ACTN|nr:copper chaperone PCu(A)C [Streptomonospora salina]MBB6001019.1 copper(I)-binding protein [Streptomonospora salina]
MSASAAGRRLTAFAAAALAAGALAGCGSGAGSGAAAAPDATAESAGPDKGGASSGPISVTGAWVPEPARADVAAAYMALGNDGEQDDALVSASSSAAPETEIHTTETADSGAQVMTGAEEVPVPAGGTTHLESGGYHLMLMDLAETPAVGDTVELTLEFDGGTEVEVQAPVLERGRTG